VTKAVCETKPSLVRVASRNPTKEDELRAGSTEHKPSSLGPDPRAVTEHKPPSSMQNHARRLSIIAYAMNNERTHMKYAILIYETSEDFTARDQDHPNSEAYCGAYAAYSKMLGERTRGGGVLEDVGTATTIRLRDGG